VSRVTAFAAFVWDFVVGEDWRLAAGVAIALGVTAAAAGGSIPVWWIAPVAVAAMLGVSLWRAARPPG
jgi:hypothetical protein